MHLITYRVSSGISNQYLKRSILSTRYVRPSTEDRVSAQRTHCQLKSSNNTPFGPHAVQVSKNPIQGPIFSSGNLGSAKITGTRLKRAQVFIREVSPCKNTTETTEPDVYLCVL